MKTREFLKIIGPGIIMAMTGVGVGDLATAGIAGNRLGTAILWAVIVGAFMKFILSEGITRWQLATDSTALEGCVRHLGRPFQILFMLYLIPWTYFVGGALVSASGVTMSAMFPLFGEYSKIVFGVSHSIAGMVLIWLGGYKLFQRIMEVCAALLFATVIACMFMLKPDWTNIIKGLLIPTIPQINSGGLMWTIALMGGVGGTLTILCYGYWIQEEGRTGRKDLKACRIDLSTGYALTALFGIAMVIIGSMVGANGKGINLILAVANCLEQQVGLTARWLFLIGAWGAVFSSLLGVWQSAPYLFADFCEKARHGKAPESPGKISNRDPFYRCFLLGITFIPMLSLAFKFHQVQKIYSFFGAFVVPFLAIALLYLNRTKLVGKENCNRPITIFAFIATLMFFAAYGFMTIRRLIGF